MNRLEDVTATLIAGPHRVVSTDLFDTVLLRDRSAEVTRLAEASRRSAATLGVDPVVLTQLRWRLQAVAYRAVTVERPDGEASLERICTTTAQLLGRGPEVAAVMHDTEVDVDIAHLRPHRALLAVLERAARQGKRVIAVSDTFYSGDDLRRILAAVAGTTPIAHVYSSADIGLTKHAGALYGEVARREGVAAEAIVHVGDNARVDVTMAEAAAWSACHLPRERHHARRRVLGKIRALPDAWRRSR